MPNSREEAVRHRWPVLAVGRPGHARHCLSPAQEQGTRDSHFVRPLSCSSSRGLSCRRMERYSYTDDPGARAVRLVRRERPGSTVSRDSSWAVRTHPVSQGGSLVASKLSVHAVDHEEAFLAQRSACRLDPLSIWSDTSASVVFGASMRLERPSSWPFSRRMSERSVGWASS